MHLLVRGDEALSSVGFPPSDCRARRVRRGDVDEHRYGTMAVMILAAAWSYRPPTRVPVPRSRRILVLALPIGLQFFSEIGVASFVGVLAGGLGAHVVAAHQIALGLATLTLMGSLGVAGATAVRVGHAVGAGESPRQVGMIGIGLGASVMIASALVFAIFPDVLLGLFTSDREVIDTGVPLLRIAAAFQLFDGIQSVAAGALRGAGDVRYSFLANAVAHWLVGLPSALVLAFGFGLGARGLWYGLTLGLVVIAVALTRRFVRISARKVARIEM